jgi:hypothetical protein
MYLLKGTMYFGTWIDAEGEFFDTAHFSDSLQKYPFKVEVVICYYGRSGLPLPTLIKNGKNAVHPRPNIPIPQTDSTKPISRLKRM